MSEFEEFTEEQLRIIRDELLPAETSPGEFDLFIEQCRRTRLDPFARQIMGTPGYARKKFKLTIVTTIDGFRLIADRSGEYDGQTEQEWCGPDGVWRTVWLDPSQPPSAARLGVYRRGSSHPVYAVLTWRESPGPGSRSPVWRDMPAHMLSKCVEALALRKAFPNDLGGLYTSDEMSGRQGPVSRESVPSVEPEAVLVSEGQADEIRAVFDQLDEDARKAAQQAYAGAWGRPANIKAEDYEAALGAARELVASRLRPVGVTEDGEVRRVPAEEIKPETEAKAQVYYKAEVMKLRPYGMSPDEFLEALLVKANAMYPSGNKGDGFESWKDLQKNPVVISELLAQTAAGTLTDLDQEPFLDGSQS